MAKKQPRKVFCPSCGSKDWEIVEGSRKKLSISKGIAGAFLTGPIGAAAGGVGLGKKGDATLHCRECGEIWQQKL